MGKPKTWTVAAAKDDFHRGLLKGASFEYHDLMGDIFYTVTIHSNVPVDGSGLIVDFRTRQPRKILSANGAVSLIRQIGFPFRTFHGA